MRSAARIKLLRTSSPVTPYLSPCYSVSFSLLLRISFPFLTYICSLPRYYHFKQSTMESQARDTSANPNVVTRTGCIAIRTLFDIELTKKIANFLPQSLLIVLDLGYGLQYRLQRQYCEPISNTALENVCCL